MLERITIPFMVFIMLAVAARAEAVVLKMNFNNAAVSYCQLNQDFNYYSCVERTLKCTTHIASIKNAKMNLTEEKRAALIFNLCFLKDNDYHQEPAWM